MTVFRLPSPHLAAIMPIRPFFAFVLVATTFATAHAQEVEEEPPSAPAPAEPPAPPEPATEPAKPAPAPAKRIPETRVPPKPVARDAGSSVPTVPSSTAAADRRTPEVEPSAIESPPRNRQAQEVERQARAFFEALLSANAKSATTLCSVPFVLEDRTIKSSEELVEAWSLQIRNKRVDLLSLGEVEILTPTEMEKKYGKPPARLTSFPWKGPNTYLAVTRLAGHAAVAVFRESNGTARVIAYHD
jgi:hypothetical protein